MTSARSLCSGVTKKLSARRWGRVSGDREVGTDHTGRDGFQMASWTIGMGGERIGERSAEESRNGAQRSYALGGGNNHDTEGSIRLVGIGTGITLCRTADVGRVQLVQLLSRIRGQRGGATLSRRDLRGDRSGTRGAQDVTSLQ